MNQPPEIAVLCGAISPEREVSLRSGAAVAEALRSRFQNVSLTVLDENRLPAFLDPTRHVVFPVIHGDYGEDGDVQMELESRFIAYAGCSPESSQVCINKVLAREKFSFVGVPVAPGLAFNEYYKPDAAALLRALGTADIVLKPADKGSSVGLHFINSETEAARVLATLEPGNWLAEVRIAGREMTVGILEGVAQGIVEIRPKLGRYDYETKYTAGASEYLYPAEMPPQVAAAASRTAERAYASCGCRDFARADFILRPDGSFVFLEINTMPGMTATSLMPKSASCCGLDFPTLCQRMISPAIQRFEQYRYDRLDT